ncbi:zinc finger protein-like 1 homolog [Nematostella vectensis]|uniref:zinc finger protein-like 1 homolog n=1 Tax=Nematostella vectensis TaxID=45351 RepID=UPI00207752A0|nr:zinc finger protein-like 1 homolog [Nematostella vectensis]
MGLCKCPKKKVTNQFCFEHRVNVCEYCLVSSHSRCIVKSYLHWLQDSDYNPVCTLCNGNLSDGDVVRLICYDVFHLSCINNFAQSLPPNTAPAGYTCPNCKNVIFPPEKMVSPVVEQLKQKLSATSWAKAGLGIPVLPEQTQVPSQQMMSNQLPQATQAQSYNKPEVQTQQEMYYKAATASRLEQRPQRDHIIQMSQQAVNPSALPQDGTVSRKIPEKRPEESLNTSVDHDENKYQRRGAIDWFSRWFGNRVNTKKQTYDDPNASLKRTMMIFFLVILAFVTVTVIFTRVGRNAAANDPFLDPRSNPHIRVEKDS